MAHDAFCEPIFLAALSKVLSWIPIIGASVLAWLSTSRQFLSECVANDVAWSQTVVSVCKGSVSLSVPLSKSFCSFLDLE